LTDELTIYKQAVFWIFSQFPLATAGRPPCLGDVLADIFTANSQLVVHRVVATRGDRYLAKTPEDLHVAYRNFSFVDNAGLLIFIHTKK
jgi:hypothetical protein